MSSRIVLVAALLGLITAGCTGSPVDNRAGPEPGSGVADTLPDATETSSTETSSTEAADDVIQGEPVLPGFPLIAVSTPSSGGGTRPLLEWESVDEASTYSVVVYAPDDAPYWGTLTDATSTYVGGPEQLVEDRPGPRIVEGSSWSVIALDADGLPLAGSGVAPIDP